MHLPNNSVPYKLATGMSYFLHGSYAVCHRQTKVDKPQ